MHAGVFSIKDLKRRIEKISIDGRVYFARTIIPLGQGRNQGGG